MDVEWAGELRACHGGRERRIRPDRPRSCEVSVFEAQAQPRAQTRPWKPRRWVRRCAEVADDAGARTLQRFVHELPARLASAGIAQPRLVSGNVVNAAHAPLLQETHRAWRFRFDASELWCVAARTQRNILHCVLQGPASQQLTALEQSILAQWLKTLLTSATAADNALEDVALPLRGPAWRCDVDVLQMSWPPIQLHFSTRRTYLARRLLWRWCVWMTCRDPNDALIPLGSASLSDIVKWAPGDADNAAGRAIAVDCGLVHRWPTHRRGGGRQHCARAGPALGANGADGACVGGLNGT